MITYLIIGLFIGIIIYMTIQNKNKLTISLIGGGISVILLYLVFGEQKVTCEPKIPMCMITNSSESELIDNIMMSGNIKIPDILVEMI